MPSNLSKKDRRERLSPLHITLLILTAVCVALSIAFRQSAAFSDAFNRSISGPVRTALAYLTTALPFSLAEAMLLLSPVALFLLIRHALRYYTYSWRAVGCYLLKVVSLVCVFFILFTLTFSAGYFAPSIAAPNKLDLNRQKVSADELYATSMHLATCVNRELDEIVFEHQGFSSMPYTKEQLNEKLMAAYDKFTSSHDFIDHYPSRVKPVMLSEPMSYTHITGVYSFFTGEANLNVNFPDYTLPFTAAHELAHQRGIAREDEANFIAYLVCIGSDDPYVRYSGYLNMFEYVSSALYRADSERYFEARSELDVPVRYELHAYSEFFDRYRDSVASEVSETVNDTYLKLQGTEGTRSYGLVVDLAVAYDKKMTK